MRKNSFVLSWGRKMFFGLGWILTSIMALNYFQSMIFPTSVLGVMYVVITFLGFYGMALGLCYFFLYAPLAWLFPYYYVTRIWSISLILALNLLIVVDSYAFSRYGHHLNSFLWDFIRQGGVLASYDLSVVKIIVVGVIFLVALIVLWLKGESIWREMGRRFTNPVSNWYLLLILFCFGLAQTLPVMLGPQEVKTMEKLAHLFPLHSPLLVRDFLWGKRFSTPTAKKVKLDYKDLYYPWEPLNCPKESRVNVVMIVLDELKYSDYKSEKMPHLVHIGEHGQYFSNHFSGGANSQDGYFSLLYALPPSYRESVLNAQEEAVFFKQLKKFKLDRYVYQSGPQVGPLTKYSPGIQEAPVELMGPHLDERIQRGETRPFFMQIYLSDDALWKKDLKLKEIMDVFMRNQILEKSIVMITGASSPELKTPLIILGVDGVRGTINKMTSHYDVLPTLITEEWRCKTSPREYSFGENLYSNKAREVHLAGEINHLMFIDVKDGSMTSIRDGRKVEVSGAKVLNKGKTLKSLHELNRFHKAI